MLPQSDLRSGRPAPCWRRPVFLPTRHRSARIPAHIPWDTADCAGIDGQLRCELGTNGLRPATGGWALLGSTAPGWRSDDDTAPTYSKGERGRVGQDPDMDHKHPGGNRLERIAWDHREERPSPSGILYSIVTASARGDAHSALTPQIPVWVPARYECGGKIRHTVNPPPGVSSRRTEPP